jgi:glycine cleavage system H protein
MTIKYHSSGLWVEQVEDTYKVGLSEKGQDDIGEVMFVELPDYGKELTVGAVLLGVEGAKAVTEINSPIAGTVKEVHKEVEDEPDLLNSEDRDENWIVELTNVDVSAFNALSDDVWKK